jgi:hypothetical protein
VIYVKKVTDKINRMELQEAYAQSNVVRAVMDHFASRERNRRTTTVERLLSNLANDGTKLSRGDVIRVLQGLEKLGCGQFIAGRKGHPSRFEWSVGLVDVGRAAAGEVIEIQPAPVEELGDEPADDLLEHHFRLRKDLDVPLRLPADLSATEAARLAAFVQTLPFDVNASKQDDANASKQA